MWSAAYKLTFHTWRPFILKDQFTNQKGLYLFCSYLYNVWNLLFICIPLYIFSVWMAQKFKLLCASWFIMLSLDYRWIPNIIKTYQLHHARGCWVWEVNVPPPMQSVDSGSNGQKKKKKKNTHTLENWTDFTVSYSHVFAEGLAAHAHRCLSTSTDSP